MRFAMERVPFTQPQQPACGPSVCGSDAPSCGAPLLLLLAWSSAGKLAGSAEISARLDTGHALHLSSLCLAEASDFATGTALLRHAIDAAPELHGGSALIASADAPEQRAALEALGFSGCSAATDQGSSEELAFLARRAPGVPPDECSHTAVIDKINREIDNIDRGLYIIYIYIYIYMYILRSTLLQIV